MSDVYVRFVRTIKKHLVRTWKGGRRLERQLKRRKKSAQLCPYCRRSFT